MTNQASPTAEAPKADVAIAAMRTDLSWVRSALAAVGCIALLVRKTWPLSGDAEVAVLATVAAAAAMWSGAYLLLRRRQRSSGDEASLVTDERVLVWITLATVLLGVAAFAVSLTASP